MMGGNGSTPNQVLLSAAAPAGESPSRLPAPIRSRFRSCVGAGARRRGLGDITIQTSTVAAATPVTISATYLGVTKTASLTVNPVTAALAALTISPSSGDRGSHREWRNHSQRGRPGRRGGCERDHLR